MLELTAWPRQTWSLFDELEALQDRMNRVFGERGYSYPSRRYASKRYPLMNAWSSEEGVTIDVELPGVTPDDVDISIMGDQLTLKGKFNAVPEKSDYAYHAQERPRGEFSRSITLPFRVDHDRVNAKYKNGILRLELPRSEAEKPKKIEVKSA